MSVEFHDVEAARAASRGRMRAARHTVQRFWPLALTVLTLILMILPTGCYWPNTGRYEGDGEIATFGLVFNRGVRVDFEPFSLSRSHSASYRLKGLPRPRYLYEIGIAPVAPDLQTEQRPKLLTNPPTGTLRFQAYRESGELVFSAERRIESYDWTWRDGIPFGRIYNKLPSQCAAFFESDFRVAGNAPSRLEISYVPDAGAPAVEVRVRIIGG